MALPRNFEYPVASFDEDLSEWEGKGQRCLACIVLLLTILSSGGQTGWEALVSQAATHAIRRSGMAWKVCLFPAFPRDLTDNTYVLAY